MCSQDEIRKSLKEMPLEDVLVKYNLTLKELFDIQNNVVMNRSSKTRREESTYITLTRNNKYIISKNVNKKPEYYGTYSDKKEAEKIVDELKKCSWDKKQLPRILKELNIKTKQEVKY